MSGLLEYSSITTKIRAMSSILLKDHDYQTLAASEDIHEAVRFLKQHKGYASELSVIDDTSIHRTDIEKLLTKTILTNYVKLYKFSNHKQRDYLKLHVKKYEIHILKTGLRMVFDNKKDSINVQLYKDFYDHYSQINITALFSSSSIQEFVSNLKGTEYYAPFLRLGNIENLKLFDYEMTLDLTYFNSLWKHKDKILTNDDLKMFTEDHGSKIDMLNIQWIYRAKKYYSMSNADIYTLLIPIRYKLKKEDIIDLVETANMDEFAVRLKETYYSKHLPDITISTLEAYYTFIRNKIQKRQIKEFPYSIASMNTYLYKKEIEVDKLTTVLEGVRYHVEPSKIIEYITEPKRSGRGG